MYELLVSLHASKSMVKPFRVASGSVGVFTSAHVLYKVAMPFRYALTLWLTPLVVLRLRLGGWLPPLAEKDRLRNLVLEGVNGIQE
ncbi:hypothetical protein TcWFU_004308 [Taenia crassiceps]|uniref:DUF1279 domain-containing protein n=1 Tax=Taenia crassiceps TaxID=6207 RepID=A0ABR4Q0Q6_9CEST